MDFSSFGIDQTSNLYFCDIDNVMFSFFENDIITVATFDWKHNGIFGEYKEENPGESIVDLNRPSIKYQIALAKRENAPAFLGITYTKENEQPIPMFFLHPLNDLAKNKLDTFVGKKLLDRWLTPYAMSQFCFKLSEKVCLPNGKYKSLSNIKSIYPLPKITCGRSNCDCIVCQITEKNNAWEKKCLK